ncbi:MAG: cell division/cell wall cluster transcriptional repressor MraZ [Alphaproteobacteria bacterium]|nr:cell division/cell wall cluster transcriptional repressor MraZ [Alphaproteobacteria bacterium]
MTLFMGTILGKLDAKGRMSIPSDFRDQLPAVPGGSSLILRPSHKYACIEGWAFADFQELAGPMEQLDPFSDAEDEMGYAVYADSNHCTPDKDGRVILSEALALHAELKDGVTFVGLRRKFEIWAPAAYRVHRAAMLERARTRKLSPSGAAS